MALLVRVGGTPAGAPLSSGDADITFISEHVLCRVDALVDVEVGIQRVVALAAIRAALMAHFEGLGGANKHHLVDLGVLDRRDACLKCSDLGINGDFAFFKLSNANLNFRDACLDLGKSTLELSSLAVVITESSFKVVNLNLEGRDVDAKVGLCGLDYSEAGVDVLGRILK